MSCISQTKTTNFLGQKFLKEMIYKRAMLGHTNELVRLLPLNPSVGHFELAYRLTISWVAMILKATNTLSNVLLFRRNYVVS